MNATRKLSPLDRLIRQIRSQPLPQTEESILLRMLVQVLVFIGIAATDVATSSGNSLWAVPISAIGAVWAYRVRHKRNITAKFLIAILMIVALTFFLGDIVRQAEDTKLLLARLLIELQVLHSFDLPRRKDLGYSTVIGLILIGVAGTLSQTMIFGVWLLLFLIVAVPVLVLDLRSRLEIPSRGFKIAQIGIAPLPMAGLLGVVLVLGLGIFALLPRLPGYQIRNFPVSVNVNVQRQVPPGGIVVRGTTTQQRNDGTGGGNGGTNADGSGNSNQGEQTGLPPLFAEEIDESRSFQFKPELVMRVRSQAELFWRVMSYDEYTGKGWRISRNAPNQIRTIKRQAFNYEFYLPPTFGTLVRPDTTQEVIQTYTIVAPNFPNLLPAGNAAYRLFFPSDEIDIDSEGNLRSPGLLPIDLTYTVISSVPLRDQTALGNASLDYPDKVRSQYLKLPENLSPKVRERTLEIINDAKNVVGNKRLELDNPYLKALYLTQTLKRPPFQLLEPKLDPKRDLVTQFIENGGGLESHFVTTLTVMLRSIGIPARYAVGFAPGKFNPFTGYYEVQNIDAMSIVEVYFPGFGWIPFDPVPGHELFPPSVEVDQTFSALNSFWKWVAGFLPSPVIGFFTVVFNSIGKFFSNTFSGLINWLFSLGWAGIFVGILIISLVGLGGWGIWQLLGWLGRNRQMRRLDPRERIYRQMMQWLAENGIPKSPHQTPQEYAAFVARQVPPERASTVWDITNAYQDWCYGDRPSSAVYLKSLLAKLRRTKSR